MKRPLGPALELQQVFLKNNCLRTFIDIRTAPKEDMALIPIQKVTKVPLMHGEQRLIIATCEKKT
jgi:hypothetical protein